MKPVPRGNFSAWKVNFEIHCLFFFNMGECTGIKVELWNPVYAMGFIIPEMLQFQV